MVDSRTWSNMENETVSANISAFNKIRSISDHFLLCTFTGEAIEIEVSDAIDPDSEVYRNGVKFESKTRTTLRFENKGDATVLITPSDGGGSLEIGKEIKGPLSVVKNVLEQITDKTRERMFLALQQRVTDLEPYVL